MDFRVLGLPVQEFASEIESHPHREAFQADLQQNNVYNPSSNNSKDIIREFGNVELFELCETMPKVQCSHCFLWKSRNCLLQFADSSWLTANPEESLTN